MTYDERIDTARILIDSEIDETFQMWTEDEHRAIYAWGWIDKLTVGSLYNTQFFYLEEVLKIVHALRLNYTLTVNKNKNGDLTPAIQIF